MNRVIIQIKASAFCLIFLLTHSTILANQLNGGGGSEQDETQNSPKEITFDTIDISAIKISPSDGPFLSAGAKSTREVKGAQTQSIDSVVRSMAGTYTNTDQSQGTVSVNIRGMSGFGRVNTSIDGVSQTFFGTSSDNARVHYGENGTSTSAFGAPVDSAFLVGVDVSRGQFSGAGGTNALMGNANFRTIGIDDIIDDRHTYGRILGGIGVGVLSRISYGSNGVGPSIMLSSAIKSKPNGESSSLGFLLGYSFKKITQNYRVGGGGKIGDQDIDIDGDGQIDNLTPFNPSTLTQKPQGILLKSEYKPNENHRLLFTYRKYLNSLAGRKIDNDNYQLDYTYNPHNPYVNLSALFAYNYGRQKYNPNTSFNSQTAISGKTSKNSAITIDLHNDFSFTFGQNLHYNLTLGINDLINEYSHNLTISDYAGAESMPFQPKGLQNLFGIYVDNNLNYKIFSLDLNLSTLRWDLIGHRGACDEVNISCFPKEASTIKKGGFNLNASALVALRIHDYFMPFVSASRSSRAPNVQEMFFSNNAGNAVNPFLKPERADTYQVGFNGFREGVFIKNDNLIDTLGYKILAYYTRVKDYIYSESFYTTDNMIMFVNSIDLAKFMGVELEVKYDIKYFFTRISYSYQRSRQPVSYTSMGELQGFGYSRYSVLPTDYATIDFGVRSFDEKFTIGSIIKYTGKAKRVLPDSTNHSDLIWQEGNYTYTQPTLQDLPKIPTIWDLYILWNPLAYISLKFEVQNVLDKNYLDALNTYNSSGQYGYNANGDTIYLFNNSARGRTFLLSVQIKW